VSIPVFSMAEIMLPPAPAPSFTNPSENAFRPAILECSSLGFTTSIGTSAIVVIVSTKFALLSSIMYYVVPIASLFWLNPTDLPNANTAAIWVPPASMTFVI